MYVIVWRDFILVNMIFLFCEQCVDTRNKTNSIMNSKCPIKFPRTLICQNILKGTNIIDKKNFPFFTIFNIFTPCTLHLGTESPCTMQVMGSGRNNAMQNSHYICDVWIILLYQGTNVNCLRALTPTSLHWGPWAWSFEPHIWYSDTAQKVIRIFIIRF